MKILCLIFFCVLVSCHKPMDKDVNVLIKSNVIIPEDSMSIRYCSLNCPYEKSQSVNLVKIFNNSSCGACLATIIAQDESKYRLMYSSVGLHYIIMVKKTDCERVYRDMCSKRVEGIVYLDTCNAFLSANPHIPDNELFHTFVINNEGKVLMVGNPFQNEKMEALFKKVIANERKKQKSKKSA